jgi:hypothetical protein
LNDILRIVDGVSTPPLAAEADWAGFTKQVAVANEEASGRLDALARRAALVTRQLAVLQRRLNALTAKWERHR